MVDSMPVSYGAERSDVAKFTIPDSIHKFRVSNMFRPIRERCPFANRNVMFANILSRSRVGSRSRTGRISANTLNTFHGYG